MENEKLLPPGEPSLPPLDPKPAPPPSLLQEPALPGMPTPAQQSWGVVISIIIIVMMIVIGAFYAWGERISQDQDAAAGALE